MGRRAHVLAEQPQEPALAHRRLGQQAVQRQRLGIVLADVLGGLFDQGAIGAALIPGQQLAGHQGQHPVQGQADLDLCGGAVLPLGGQ